MAVPKPTETRCRDGPVQARHVIQRNEVIGTSLSEPLLVRLTPMLFMYYVDRYVWGTKK